MKGKGDKGKKDEKGKGERRKPMLTASSSTTIHGIYLPSQSNSGRTLIGVPEHGRHPCGPMVSKVKDLGVIRPLANDGVSRRTPTVMGGRPQHGMKAIGTHEACGKPRSRRQW